LRGAAILVFFWLLPSEAGAQISGTASVVSDYRYRGFTLSDQKPAAQIGFTYDDPLGWYAGAFGSTVRLAAPAGPNFQAIAFGGFASRLASGITLEAGGDYSAFTGAAYDDYGEIFVGAATENLSARIYYSPRYFGQSSNSVYGEINVSQTVVGSVRLLAHVGFLRTRYEGIYRTSYEQHIVDGRIGLGVDLDPFHVELAWVGVSAEDAAYRVTGSSSPNTVVLTLSCSF
jgi:uncharacterized protein (TIGR02001 family)